MNRSFEPKACALELQNGSLASIMGYKTKKNNKIKQRNGDEAFALDFFREHEKLFKLRDAVDQLTVTNKNHLENSKSRKPETHGVFCIKEPCYKKNHLHVSGFFFRNLDKILKM